jgi:hypothetical protein
MRQRSGPPDFANVNTKLSFADAQLSIVEPGHLYIWGLYPRVKGKINVEWVRARPPLCRLLILAKCRVKSPLL